MTLKKANTLKTFEDTEIPKVNQNFDQIVSTKVESLNKRTSPTVITPYTFQSIESGEVGFSANGSATIVKSFGFKDTYSVIITAMAHSKNILVSAHVTDVTNTGLTIECRTISGTALFSSVTTASFTVYYQVIGSAP